MDPRVHKLRQTLFDPLAWHLSRRELRGLMRARDPEALVDATERYVGRGVYARIPAVQEREEILELVRIVRRLEPRVIVEIGTFKGGTLFLWCRTNPRLELVVSIDLPGGRWGGGYADRRRRLYREFLRDRPGAEMALLRADSHAPETLDTLRRELGGAPIDFLYVDGDHSYDGVKQDFEMYSPLVRRGGCVAFHDVATRNPDVEVDRFWREIRDRYDHRELVAEGSNKGIGVLFL